MSSTTIAPTPAVTLPQAATASAPRRRRAVVQSPLAHDARAGAALVTQQLPFTVRASVRVSNPLLYAAAGAAVGALLLGVPGAVIGGIAGWMIAT